VIVNTDTLLIPSAMKAKDKPEWRKYQRNFPSRHLPAGSLKSQN